jgi:hypothetical protein
MVRLGYLCLLLAAFITGCTGQLPEVSDDPGSMSLALAAAGPDGAVYRLRNAAIHVSGPTAAVIETEADPFATVRSVSAAPGNYEIIILEGWSFERVDPIRGTATSVEATLASPNPQAAHVAPGNATTVRLRFTVDGLGDVVLDPGQINVGIEVGAPSCEPAPQGGCADGKKCTDFQGNSRCAPDGNVAEGGACTTEGGVDDCAAGSFCQAGVCTRLCGISRSECNCQRVAGLFADNEDIGLCSSAAPSCDPIAQDCPMGEACYYTGEPLTGCAPAGTVAVGGTCQFANSCVPGASCAVQYQDRMQPECVAHCIPGGSAPGCGPNAACIQINDPSTSQPTFGVCVDCTRMPEACVPQ